MSSEYKDIVPLAERARPKSLSEFVGQEHLTGKNKPIRLMIEKDSLSSFILWGSPGTGKTTLAKIIANETKAEFYQINAVSSGVKDIRNVISIADGNFQNHKKTILFIDEIHRFNKSQQDALLSSVEQGIITLIGATTENPSFEVIPALRSRARVYKLNDLTKTDLQIILSNVIKTDSVLREKEIEIIDENYLLLLSGGDARTLLNILESCVSISDHEKVTINKETIDSVVLQKNVVYDKDGEEHYNVISAFIKSIRGSDPDAALYWMVRMLEGGEDPIFIARRLLILASEDVGNAAPNGLVLAEAAFSAVEKIGLPEARIILAQCVTYLASSPKSNASYVAIDLAYNDVRNKPLYPVPLHLRNAPTKLMKDLGYSQNYKYPHNYDTKFVVEDYFPPELKNKQYYSPSENGQEKKLKDWLNFLWKGKKQY